MRAVVLFDSTYGNTEQIARAIGGALEDCRVLAVSQAAAREASEAELLIVGCPTQGGRPTKPIAKMLGGLGTRVLAGTFVAAFDTRFAAAEQSLGLRLLMRVIGYAAPKIAAQLEKRGGRLATPPEGFIVVGKEGPLRPGELERAHAWAKRLVEKVAVPA
jgi:flavodoxin I